jgi:hypothetical protein
LGFLLAELVLDLGSADADMERAAAGLLLNHFEGLVNKLPSPEEGDAALGNFCVLCPPLPLGETDASGGCKVFVGLRFGMITGRSPSSLLLLSSSLALVIE